MDTRCALSSREVETGKPTIGTMIVWSPAKIAVLSLFFVCTPKLAISTTVMAVFTPTLVTIGVDGLGTYRRAGEAVPIKSCKALATEDTVYVASGSIPEHMKENVIAIGDWFAARR